MRPSEGAPAPLGSTCDGAGVNFALYSAHATAVELCLYGSDGQREMARLQLPGRTGDIFHGHVQGVTAGQLYGYRVHGAYDPSSGHRFNPNKLLIDPYARELHGRITWSDELYAYPVGGDRGDLGFDLRDSASAMPKCVVAATPDPWLDRSPERAWSDTVIYEAHVKGFTQLRTDLPETLRGTYAALGSPVIIDHLLSLGVTAVELLPIQAFSEDHFLVRRGLRNYWGYSTLNFFTPDHRYHCPDGPLGLRQAIRALHDANIEVILDVVYNHTAEVDGLGPTLSFRGIDNASYYKLDPNDPRRYRDWAGCGNILDIGHPRVLQLVLDSMRHWVEHYHVDGFRFDLAPILGRDGDGFSARARFFQAVGNDPALSKVKLIAEPWDLGPDGYRTGSFPVGWSEWNDGFRDKVRAFWCGQPAAGRHLSAALTGSREVFQAGGRNAFASINYVACHDGFPLHDVVSYDSKHNEANGEDNHDGHDRNYSRNYGIEGPTDDAEIKAIRKRQKRNLLATLFLSRGVPMLSMGDEFSRTQRGNNNAYCQDNEMSWLDWRAGHAADPELVTFVQDLSELRRRLPGLRTGEFLTGALDPASGLKDVYWLAAHGREMTIDDWHDEGCSALGIQTCNGAAGGPRTLLLVNASERMVAFTLEAGFPSGPWRPVLDTAGSEASEAVPTLAPGGTIALASRSLVLFEHSSGEKPAETGQC